MFPITNSHYFLKQRQDHSLCNDDVMCSLWGTDCELELFLNELHARFGQSQYRARWKPYTENIRGLNLTAVKRTTVQVSRLLLWHDLLYWACADRVYILHIQGAAEIITTFQRGITNKWYELSRKTFYFPNVDIKTFFTLGFKNYIIQMVAVMADTHLEPFFLNGLL
jgi:hypothetical protein